MRGTSDTTLNSSSLFPNSTCIIDFEGTEHIIFYFKKFSFLKPSSQKYISTTNGSSVPIIGKEALSLTNNLNSNFFLIVPSLNYNLLSLSQITVALYYILIFWREYYVFKYIRTRQLISSGTRQEKLYYLNLESENSNLAPSILVDVFSFKDKTRKSNILAMALTIRTCFLWLS